MKFPPELLKSWLERHASLELLCEFDGWPDTSCMQVELQKADRDRLRLLVTLDEIVEARDCGSEPFRRSGCFELQLDEDGQPHSAVLIQIF